MLIRHPPLPPAAVRAAGPGNYFVRGKDARGRERVPSPSIRLGDPAHFDRLVRASTSPHPHLHGVLAYGRPSAQPSRRVKDQILETYLNVMRAGLNPDSVYILAVDHGNHDHVALYRHLVAPNWPRYQPYYHPNDWLVVSDLVWLTNLRHGLDGPENPKHSRLISIAGRGQTQPASDFAASVRQEMEIRLATGKLKRHEHFLEYLQRDLSCRTKALSYVKRNEDPEEELMDADKIDRRGWLKVTTHDGLEVAIKGPLCNPSFRADQYQAELADDTHRYQEFLENPFILWRRFLDGHAKRCKANRNAHPGHCDPEDKDPIDVFGELDPSQHHPPQQPMMDLV